MPTEFLRNNGPSVLENTEAMVKNYCCCKSLKTLSTRVIEIPKLCKIKFSVMGLCDICKIYTDESSLSTKNMLIKF